ncbi:hypothetical protein [uncultured Eubacterium sp.]|uniref:hypothetical protein n=1 Tax=uncultured Eubacterium sp. TaxID=165185 RepID=UPI0025D9C66F|nr:hypothetical protein [uncultured Eubacterium sp.]
MYCLENRQTLLWHLLCEGYEPQHYLENLENIEIAINDKEYFKEHPEEASEEAQYIDDDIETWEEELRYMSEGWRPTKEVNMNKEIDLIKKWVEEKENNE